MSEVTFETPDGDEIQIDGSDVVDLFSGRNGDITIIELEDGEEVSVLATRVEVVSALDLDPLKFLAGDGDDEDEFEDYDNDNDDEADDEGYDE